MCKDKYIYKNLGKNYLDVDMIYNETKTNKIYDKMSNIIMKKIIDANLSVSNGKILLNDLYRIYDEGNKEFEKFASCKKGCNHCCYLYIDCTAIEAEAIRDYIVTNFCKDDIQSIKLKIDKVINTVNLKGTVDSLNYLEKKLPCPFLNDDNCCSIYKVRPFNCRKFLTCTSPIQCSLNEDILRLNPSINNIGMYSISLLSSNITRYRNLVVSNNNAYTALYKNLSKWFENGFEDINRKIED